MYGAVDGAVGEVCGDDVARVEVVNGSDGLTVLSEEAVALAVDTLGVTSVEALLEEFDAVLSEEELAFLGALESEDEVVDAVHLFVHAMDEPFGDGGRCLERLMGDEVQDRDIAGVTDTGEDRQFELRTDGTELVVIKTGEVGGGTTAADDGYAIVFLIFDF